MLVGDREQYLRIAFENEAELERFVQENYELLFGSASIYVPQRRISTAGGKATVPDAVVIDLENSRWYVVEVELAKHGTWEHIAPQVSKQLAAVSNPATQESIVTTALDAVRASENLREALSEFGIEEFSLHGAIAEILKQLPTVAIPIDEVPDDLQEWADTLRHVVQIQAIEKYVNDEGRVLFSVPAEVTPRLSTAQGLVSVPETSFGGGKALKRVMDKGLLVPGQKLHMIYGPRGQDKQTFHAVVREDGLEIDGRVFSPSYAAFYCMRKAGSDRKSANGWMHWRTEDGSLINELYRRAAETEGDAAQSLALD